MASERVTSSVTWIPKSFTWHIHNFSDVIGLHSGNAAERLIDGDFHGEFGSILEIDYVQSPMIEVEHGPDGAKSSWIIKLVLDPNEPDSVSVEFQLAQMDRVMDCYFRYTLSLVGTDGQALLLEDGNKFIHHSREGISWYAHNFLQKDYLREHEAEALQDDTLKLKLDLKIFNDFEHSVNPPPNSGPTSTGKKKRKNSTSASISDWELGMHSAQTKLAKKIFAGLWESKKGCDAKIQCNETTFPIHKFVLSAASPVFAAAFSNKMKEGAEGKIKIVDMSPNSVELLLRFIYCCEVSSGSSCVNPKDSNSNAYWEDVDILGELLNAAEKYQVAGLKSLCFLKLCEELMLNNAGQVVILVHLFQPEDPKVKKFVYQYVVSNMGVLRGLEGFKKKLEEVPAAFALILFEIGRSIDI